MGRVILFDGGNAGGIYIHSSIARTIPPFAPVVLAHLRAISDLLQAAAGQAADSQIFHDLQVSTTRIANLAIERVEAVIGPLDGADSLVYVQGNRGFICGATGAPPRPIVWPPATEVSFEDFVQRGSLGPDLLEFLQRAHDKGLKATDVLEDPVASAMIVGAELSSQAVETLQRLRPSQLHTISDPVNRKVIEFWHRVIEDGRYVDVWMTEPASVAQSLGVELEAEAIDRILGSTAIVGRAEPMLRVSISQGIVIGIVAIALAADKYDPQYENVKDFSGTMKF